MARKGENIYKRCDGRWEGRYIYERKPDGQAKYRSVYGKTYTEVRASLQQRKMEQTIPRQRCPMTVKELFEQWLYKKQQEIKPSSYHRYAALTQRHIIPELGALRVSSLTAETLNAFIVQKLRTGRLDGRGGLAPKSVNDLVALCKSALRLAHQRYAIADSGIWEVKPPAVRQRTVETLGDQETARLSRAVLTKPDLSGAAYLLCLNTGLRLGELCGLKWSDFNFDEGFLQVNRTVLRLKVGSRTQLAVQTPKSEASERTIPLTAELIQLFTRLRGAAPADAYVLTRQADLPMEPRTMQYRFHSFLKKHQLRDHHFHTLRHTFATRCVEQGADAKTLSEILGHSSVKTTLQIYVHPSMEQKRRFLCAVSTISSIGIGESKENLPSKIWSAGA